MLKVLPALLLSVLPLAAQAPEPNRVGGQARLSLPGGNLPDATGGRAPGLGGSLLAELHFEDMDDLAFRVGMGADNWFKHGGDGNRAAASYYLGAELAYFFTEKVGSTQKGPYLVGGLQGVTWALGASPDGTQPSVRTLHAAVTVGFGYRFSRRLDVEVTVLAGPVSPGFTANTTRVGATWWF